MAKLYEEVEGNELVPETFEQALCFLKVIEGDQNQLPHFQFKG